MRAADLDEAIELANDTPFGLTSGIQSLDDREVARWLDRIEAGNLYVNRPITGAIVGRQPFGGWKASSVGPGAKAGGPNYVLQLARWRQVAPPAAGAPCSPAVAALLERCLEAAAGDEACPPSPLRGEGRVRGNAAAVLRASAASYAHAWQEHFGREHEPIRLLGERNVFRYRPCWRILVRADAGTPAGRLALGQVLLAARTCAVPVVVSLANGQLESWLTEASDVTAVVETEADLIGRLGLGGFERLRALVPISRELRATAHAAAVAVLDAPVLATGRLELRHYLREQTISRVVHRYGNVIAGGHG
jgi:RHH-type proline utilization regulon transcriptional repressor/proline dehydrogenase/delta 1-pyrroline-5-carboxylate dehydrogenase